ncbi:energy transducer TonB [Solimonas sp. K1W22B-7]|nr:energy transducer TonB [Solimonas sp. K1W22B-7]
MNLGSLAVVVAVHLLALWGILAASKIAPEAAAPKPLYVSFIETTAPEPVKPPEPPPPEPPRPVEQPKPKPLITTTATAPAPNAIEAPPEPVEPEPLPPIQAAPPPSPVAAPEPVVEPPRFDLAYLNNPPPAYPQRSRQLGEEGTVKLLVNVSATGSVLSVSVQQSSGFPRLDEAAKMAVRRWRFTPSKRGDVAVAGVASVPIIFNLPK